MNMPNAWIDRFDPEISEKDLADRVRVQPAPLTDLAGDGLDVAIERLKAAQQQVLVPTKQTCRVLRTLISAAYMHAQRQYDDPLIFDDPLKFVQSVYGEVVQERWTPPICLTGLSGIGKSALLRALLRAFPAKSEVEIANHGRFPLDACWMMTTEAGMGADELLRPHLRDTGARYRNVRFAARRELLLCGVSLLALDELQFITQSDANVKASKTLMQLSFLGPPLVYCANYSLLHRLLLRPHEERQRLFTRTIVMVADSPGSEDWVAVLQGLLNVAPEFGHIDVGRQGNEIHRYTAGLPRLAASLLAAAYRAARERNSSFVDMRDVDNAYLSTEFAVDREDVELLKKQAITGSWITDERGNRRRDLWCPLGARHPSNLHMADQAIAEHERRVSEKMVESSLTPAERGDLQKVKAGINPSGDKSATVVRLRRPAATKNNLLEGADMFARKPGRTDPARTDG